MDERVIFALLGIVCLVEVVGNQRFNSEDQRRNCSGTDEKCWEDRGCCRT